MPRTMAAKARIKSPANCHFGIMPLPIPRSASRYRQYPRGAFPALRPLPEICGTADHIGGRFWPWGPLGISALNVFGGEPDGYRASQASQRPNRQIMEDTADQHSAENDYASQGIYAANLPHGRTLAPARKSRNLRIQSNCNSAKARPCSCLSH